jgi:hypothetical protein
MTEPTEPTEPTEKLDQKYKTYLDGLRESGATNMFGAGAYVEQVFGVSRREASEIVIQWMEEFE